MTESPTESITKGTYASFPMSWVDRFIQWIERLPGPPWVFYLLSALVVTILTHTLFWMDGAVAVGSIVPINTSLAVSAVSTLGLYHYLTRVGSRSLRSFRPLLEVDDSGFSRIEHELVTLPRRLGLVTVPLGFGLVAASVLGDPTSFGDLVPQTALPYLAAITLAGFLATTVFCFLLRSARQLRMVGKLHARATNINLLKLQPPHAFSALTVRTAIGIILFLVVGYLLDPASFGSVWDIASYLAAIVLAIAVFALPLMGMRTHLEVEKLRILNEIADSLQIASDRLHSKVANKDYGDMKETESAINALIHQRELISKVSTLPWHPATVRGLGSAVILPLFLWVVFRLLERLF